MPGHRTSFGPYGSEDHRASLMEVAAKSAACNVVMKGRRSHQQLAATTPAADGRELHNVFCCHLPAGLMEHGDKFRGGRGG